MVSRRNLKGGAGSARSKEVSTIRMHVDLRVHDDVALGEIELYAESSRPSRQATARSRRASWTRPSVLGTDFPHTVFSRSPPARCTRRSALPLAAARSDPCLPSSLLPRPSVVAPQSRQGRALWLAGALVTVKLVPHFTAAGVQSAARAFGERSVPPALAVRNELALRGDGTWASVDQRLKPSAVYMRTAAVLSSST